MTPLKAVRLYCRWCTNDYAPAIRDCPSEQCPLHNYRMGKGRGSTLRTIRLKCLDCSCQQPSEVHDCKFTDCALYQYRMGRNPARAGQGPRKPAFLAKNPDSRAVSEAPAPKQVSQGVLAVFASKQGVLL